MVFMCFCLVVCEVMDISEVLCTLNFYIVAKAANLIWVSVTSKFITSSSCFVLHIYRVF